MSYYTVTAFITKSSSNLFIILLEIALSVEIWHLHMYTDCYQANLIALKVNSR